MAGKEKMKEGKGKKILFYFAILLLIVSLVIFLFSLAKISEITGRATGTANLTVETRTQINFTTNNIDWGTGALTAGSSSATLNTAAGADNMTNGNWTGNAAGLVIENIGNQNATLDLAAGKTNATLLGGTNPDYEWNITNVEAGSCNGTTLVAGLGGFEDVNTSARVCNVFSCDDGNDTIRIDIKLVIPSDSLTGAISDTITATATAIG